MIGEAGSLSEARDLPDGDVALVDLTLPDGIAIDLIQRLASGNACGVIALTASIDERLLAQTAEAGARGIVGKSEGFHAIIDGVRKVGAGGWLFTPMELIEIIRQAGAAAARRSRALLHLPR